MAAEPVPEFAIRTLVPTPSTISAAVGITDSTGANLLGVDASGRITVKLTDGSGNSLTSDAGILNIDIAEQSLTAVKVSATAAANTLANPLFYQRSDGSAALGTTANPDNSTIVVGGAVKGAVAAPFYVGVTDGAAAYGEAANPFAIEVIVGGAIKGAVAAPLFVELSDGTNPFGTEANPLFVVQVSDPSPVGLVKRLNVMGANITKLTSTNADFTVPASKVWDIHEIEMSPGEFGHFQVILDPATANVDVGTYFTQGGATYRKQFLPPIDVPTLAAGEILRVVRNNDGNKDAKFSVSVLVVETDA